MNLYQLKTEYQSALESLVVDEETGEILGIEALEAIKDDIKDKLLNYGKYVKTLQAEASAYKQEKQRVEREIKKRDKKIEYLKSVISANLKDDDKIEDTQCKLNYRKTKRVTIDELDLLPDEFIEYTPKVKKTELKLALVHGDISGARLETCQHLQIK